MKNKALSDYSQLHKCCPKDFRGTHDITGHHELDAVIERNTNNCIPARLELYVETEATYGPRTGYDGYHNYSGDT